MAFLKGINKPAQAPEPKLDLKALQSYSPQWSPALRYTTCIAARFAAAECVKHVKEFAEGLDLEASKGAEEDENRNEHFEEEGEEQQASGDGEGDRFDAQRRKRRRREFVQDWEEFAQKFSLATAQHLGIDEATLPPADVSAEDVLKAARGDSFKRKKDADPSAELQDLSLDEKKHEIQIQGEGESSPSTGALENGQSIEVVHELLLVALGLGQYRASDGSTTLFEQDVLFGDLPEDDAYSPSSEPAKVPKATSGPSRRDERSTEKAIAEAETRAHESDIQPREKDAVDVVSEAGQKAWSTISTGALTGWKAIGKGVSDATKAVSNPRSDQQASEQGGHPPSDLAYTPRKSKEERAKAKAKPKAPTKPNELCHYDARARAVIFATSQAMGMEGIDVYQGEKALAQAIFFLLSEGRQAAEEKADGGDPLADLPRQDARGAWMNKVSESTVEKEKRKVNWGKWAATGAGFAIGGVIIGLTGGLAAPVIAPALVGLTGVSFLATTSGIVLMGTLLGLGGGGLAGYRVQQRLRGLESFEFVGIRNQAREAGLAIPSLHATICVSGLLLKEEDQVKPWEEALKRTVDSRDIYAIKSETKMMVEAGTGLRGYVLDQILRAGGKRAAQEVIKHTALAGFAALTLPLTVMGAASAALDGVFVRAKTKAHKAGLVLAETLRKEVQGHRPVVLIGTSLGCTTILAALVELAKTPCENAHLIDSVFLISGPMTPSPSTLRKARSIVSRRFVNAYSSKDMVSPVARRIKVLLSDALVTRRSARSPAGWAQESHLRR